ATRSSTASPFRPARPVATERPRLPPEASARRPEASARCPEASAHHRAASARYPVEWVRLQGASALARALCGSFHTETLLRKGRPSSPGHRIFACSPRVTPHSRAQIPLQYQLLTWFRSAFLRLYHVLFFTIKLFTYRIH